MSDGVDLNLSCQSQINTHASWIFEKLRRTHYGALLAGVTTTWHKLQLQITNKVSISSPSSMMLMMTLMTMILVLKQTLNSAHWYRFQYF